MRKNIKIIVSLLMVISIFTACGVTKEQKSTEKSNKLKVYTTIYPLQFLAEQIGNGYVEVENITPPGTEAHSFDPSQKTVVKIAQSDMFIYSGTGMEGFADKVTKTVKKEKVSVVKAVEGVKLISAKTNVEQEQEQKQEKHEKELDVDPHVWLDPVRTIKMAENIKEAYIKLKPDAKDEFEKNFNMLKQKLENLDQKFKEVATKAPKKTFVVSHSAYGYWNDVYGIKQIGISGLSPTDEPSSRKLKEIIELAKENNISYILFEPNLSNKVASVVKREVGADTLTLHNLESLTENEIQNKDDYLSIMENNILSLQKALQ